jgi:hypothetical protein
MGRCVLWWRFTDISKKPVASFIKIEQPPIYSAGEDSRFFSNTCICHHIPVNLILISISQPFSCLPSGLFLSCSRPFKNRTVTLAGYKVGQLVLALHYKPVGCGFSS